MLFDAIYKSLNIILKYEDLREINPNNECIILTVKAKSILVVLCKISFNFDSIMALDNWVYLPDKACC